MSLELRVSVRSLFLQALAAGIIFLPASSWKFWQGWAFRAERQAIVETEQARE
jgi:hypothetical protein